MQAIGIQLRVQSYTKVTSAFSDPHIFRTPDAGMVPGRGLSSVPPGGWGSRLSGRRDLLASGMPLLENQRCGALPWMMSASDLGIGLRAAVAAHYLADRHSY